MSKQLSQQTDFNIGTYLGLLAYFRCLAYLGLFSNSATSRPRQEFEVLDQSPQQTD